MANSAALGLPVAPHWFHIEHLADDIICISEPHVHELVRANAFVVKGRALNLLIDSGLGVVELRPLLKREGLLDKPITAVATHAHYDHVGSMYEFGSRLIHSAEAEALATASDGGTLWSTEFPEPFRRMCTDMGLPLPDLLIDAFPRAGYDPDSYLLRPAAPTGVLEEGSTLDLGDRTFQVLHLPGHSPGGIGLWDPANGVLFSGDAIYNGPLIDEELPGADIPAYILTMRRLRTLPASIVHPGHYASFNRRTMLRIVDDYLLRRDGP